MVPEEVAQVCISQMAFVDSFAYPPGIFEYQRILLTEAVRLHTSRQVFTAIAVSEILIRHEDHDLQEQAGFILVPFLGTTEVDQFFWEVVWPTCASDEENAFTVAAAVRRSVTYMSWDALKASVEVHGYGAQLENLIAVFEEGGEEEFTDFKGFNKR